MQDVACIDLLQTQQRTPFHLIYLLLTQLLATHKQPVFVFRYPVSYLLGDQNPAATREPQV